MNAWVYIPNQKYPLNNYRRKFLLATKIKYNKTGYSIVEEPKKQKEDNSYHGE